MVDVTITLQNEPIVDEIRFDIAHGRALVYWRILTADGDVWKQGISVFKPNLPTDPAPPDNWHNLPSSYVQTVIDMRDAAKPVIAAEQGLA